MSAQAAGGGTVKDNPSWTSPLTHTRTDPTPPVEGDIRRAIQGRWGWPEELNGAAQIMVTDLIRPLVRRTQYWVIPILSEVMGRIAAEAIAPSEHSARDVAMFAVYRAITRDVIPQLSGRVIAILSTEAIDRLVRDATDRVMKGEDPVKAVQAEASPLIRAALREVAKQVVESQPNKE